MRETVNWGLHRSIALLLMCLICAQPAAQTPADAEQRLQQVRRELQTIANERRQLDSRRGTAAQQLRQIDEQVAAAARALRQTQTQLNAERRALNDLTARRNDLNTRLSAQRGELAALLRAAYAEGESAPLKQLLAQDRVGDAARALVYHRYLQRHRQQRIAALQRELAELTALETEISARQRALEAARTEQQRRTRTLERDRRTRAQTRARLDSQYAERSARERALGEDARALEQLLAQLRAAAARQPAAPRPDDPASTAPPPRGQGWPVAGNLVSRFNQPMADGRRSTGILIAAAPGTEVHAVQSGRVVFSDWMTGYGMLLILDHGNDYMSLYAHNESLYKQVGESVQRGEAIASVGNSGSGGTAALYFELRHRGQPVNPDQWLRRE